MPGKLKIVVGDFHLGAGSSLADDNPLEDFVADDSLFKGGYFLVYDHVAKKPLALTLE